MDIRLQHHLAQEFYRQQMFQRISGKFPSMNSSINFIWMIVVIFHSSQTKRSFKLMLLMKLMDFFLLFCNILQATGIEQQKQT